MSAQSHGDHHDHHDHDHDHAHHHDHGHDHAPKSFGAAFAVGTLLNLGLVVGQIVFGLAANSVALLADAAHNFGDVLALLLAWGAAWLGQQSPSTRRTYGWGRSSILAALINAVVLLVGAGAIAVEALHRLQDPGPVGGMTVIFVGLAGIVINGFTAYLFSHGHDDLNIRAAFLHMMSDAAVSLGVVLAAGGILLTGWLWLDPLASLLIVAAIILGTWGTLRDAVNLAMDGVPTRIAHDDVQAHLRALPDVIEVHDLHIWGLSTTQIALTAHFAIDHATLQVETAASAEICALRPAHVV
jgi:cobalt-zinc-cadmium efflux system protein